MFKKLGKKKKITICILVVLAVVVPVAWHFILLHEKEITFRNCMTEMNKEAFENHWLSIPQCGFPN